LPDPLTGLLLSDDLIFASRICGTACDLGFTMKTARSVEALEELARQERPGCVIVDLANPGLALAELMRHLAAACTPIPRVVAYGPHVDAPALGAARAAGCDPVLPRSKFVEQLPRALQEWLKGPTPQ
jgi:CheY-like chemotaxis protein